MTNSLHPRPRPAWRGCLGKVFFGLLLAALTFALAALGLVVISQAAWGTPLPPIDLAWVEQMAADAGLIPAPSPILIAMAPTSTATPSVTPFQPAAPTTTSTPSDTPSTTPTPSETTTPSATVTEATATSATATSPTATDIIPSPARSRTPSRTPSRIPTRTRTPTRTATRTSTLAAPTSTPTPSLSPTPSVTPGEGTGTAPPPPSATDVPPTATSAACHPTDNTSFENTLLGLINVERRRQGLAAYSLQSQLQAAARLHSTDMACNGFLSHTGSDGSSVRDRVERQGYSWSWIGENIYATGNTSSSAPQQAFDWWMNSAPHRANLLSPNYTETGIGYAYLAGSPYGGYFTAVFARP